MCQESTKSLQVVHISGAADPSTSAPINPQVVELDLDFGRKHGSCLLCWLPQGMLDLCTLAVVAVFIAADQLISSAQSRLACWLAPRIDAGKVWRQKLVLQSRSCQPRSCARTWRRSLR